MALARHTRQITRRTTDSAHLFLFAIHHFFFPFGWLLIGWTTPGCVKRLIIELSAKRITQCAFRGGGFRDLLTSRRSRLRWQSFSSLSKLPSKISTPRCRIKQHRTLPPVQIFRRRRNVLHHIPKLLHVKFIVAVPKIALSDLLFLNFCLGSSGESDKLAVPCSDSDSSGVGDLHRQLNGLQTQLFTTLLHCQMFSSSMILEGLIRDFSSCGRDRYSSRCWVASNINATAPSRISRSLAGHHDGFWD